MNILSNNFYRLDRILNWKNASGYQLENSLITISNSGLTGFGFNKNIIYFPEPQTDFIFTSYVANFGFLGASFLILIILIFDTTILRLVTKKINQEDKYILLGISSSFALSFKIEIMAEILTGNTSLGLGSAILSAQRNDPTNMIPIFSYSLLTVIFVLLISFVFKKINRLLLK